MIRPLSTFLLLLGFASTCGIAQAQIDLTDIASSSAAVTSILEAPRETPAQELNAVFTLLDLGELEIARTVWEDFAGEGLKGSDKASLVSQFGAARFLNLARREDASGLDGARGFAESCLQAAAKFSSDPKRLAKLVSDLGSESGEVQQAARSDLAVTGDAGAIACLGALAVADSETQRTQLLLTLAKMRPGVEPMLIAAIADGRGQFRRDVVELAGYLHLQDAVPWLSALAVGADSDPAVISAAHAALAKMGLSSPNVADARAVVLNKIRRLEAHQHPPTFENTWWSFDAEQKKLSAREVAPDENQLLKIARLARTLGQAPNATDSDRRLALIYAYQVSHLLKQPLPTDYQQWADTFTTADLNETLHDALQGNQITAGIACAKLLSTRKDAAALSSVAGRRSPLAAALVHPNRELRYAALEAVMKIAPSHSFAGASGVPKALWQFAVGAGDPQAIAASSVVSRASDWAGQLRGSGYDAEPVVTGRAAMRLAIASPRLEVVLLDSDINRPALREVLYQLRSNPHTARVTMAILCSTHNLERAKQIAEQDPYLLAISRPHSNEALADILDQLAELDPGRLAAERRGEQAAAALGWIADLLESGHPYDELLRESTLVGQTLYVPELTSPSLRVLTVLGTASSQQLLLDYISSPTLPIESRREAGDAFAKSVERFGKLLTSEEIVRQYDRYNASETADRETQKVLGAVLDILEK